MNNPYKIVEDFEYSIAEFSGSKFAVAVDCCSNALFLCLKYLNQTDKIITIPNKTYISVPCAIRNAGYKLKFNKYEWSGVYKLDPLPIYDGALRFNKNMYKDGLHCLSFHINKSLKIGRGGMILTDDEVAYNWLKLARFNGRGGVNTAHLDTIKMIGWNFYMTNADAARGLWLFSGMKPNEMGDIKSEYADLSIYDFNNTNPGEELKKNL
jgi:dTDP-4-amino-4,6-dideoxygalactose transaminase